MKTKKEINPNVLKWINFVIKVIEFVIKVIPASLRKIFK